MKPRCRMDWNAGRAALGAACAALAALLPCQAAFAQEYPGKPIRLVAPFSPGGGGDTVARLIAQKLSDAFQQQVVVDNRPGAGNIIGTEIVAKAAPDGYTILVAINAHAINPGLRRKLPYDPIADFTPVTLIASTPYILVVHPSLPVRSVQELIRLAKSRPGQINYASAGSGTPAHFAAELFKLGAAVGMVHVPYKGVTGAVIDLMAGAVQVMFPSPVTALPQVKAGKLRALAVTTLKRSRAMPELPTIDESGVRGYEFSSWYGLLAPRNTAESVVNRLQQAVAKAVQLKDVQTRLVSEGAEPAGSTPAEFLQFLKEQIARYGKLARAIGLQVD